MVISNFGFMIQTAQSSDVLISVAAISAASAITSAVLVGYVNYRAGKRLEMQRFENNEIIEKKRIQHVNQLEKQKLEYTEYKRKQQTYSQLMGQSRAKLQIYSAYFNAQINANYYDMLSIINAISRIDYDLIYTHSKEKFTSEINEVYVQERSNSIFYREQQNERERLADYMLLSAKSSEQFFIIIGLLKVLFPNTQNLRESIKQVEASFGEFSRLNIEFDLENNKMAAKISVSEIRSNAERDELVDKWSSEVNSKKTKNINHYVNIYADVNSKIDNLLNYLEGELKKELYNKKMQDPFKETK